MFFVEKLMEKKNGFDDLLNLHNHLETQIGDSRVENGRWNAKPFGAFILFQISQARARLYSKEETDRILESGHKTTSSSANQANMEILA